MKKYVLIICLILCLTGCTTPENLNTSEQIQEQTTSEYITQENTTQNNTTIIAIKLIQNNNPIK